MTVMDGSPIKFDISASRDYIDFAKTVLYIKAKVTRNNSRNLATCAYPAVNLFLQSVFASGHFAISRCG